MKNNLNTQELINFLLSQQKEEKTIELSNCYKLFMEHLTLHNRAGTKKSYICILKPIWNYFKKNKIYATHQLTDELINQYALFRIPLVKPQTINKEISALETMLKLMVKYKYIDYVSFHFEKLAVRKTKIESITKQSIDKILNHLKTTNTTNRNKLIFLLILTTGIRTTELINIKTKNIDLDKKKIYLEHTKNKETRYIYLVDDVVTMIRKVIQDTEFLFVDENKNQMSTNALRLFFKYLKKTCNIQVLSPHKLRHYYATNIYNKSKDISLVKDLLGHKSIQMTQIYLDINNEDNQKKNSYYSPLNDCDPLTRANL